MKKRIRWYATIAVILAAGFLALWVYSYNKGVPSVDLASYVRETFKPAQSTEVSFLPGSNEDLPGMKLVAQTNELSLYYHPESTEFAVLNKDSGKVWRSNPADRDEDNKALSFSKELLSSQLSITFRDNAGRIGTFSNFEQSISRNQFIAESIENGIRITYTLGDMSLGIDSLPKLISRTRMEEKVLNKLDEAKARYVSTRYIPLKSDPEILERLDTAVARQLVLTRMIDAFQEAGYGAEDLEFDNEENGIGGVAGQERPNFTIPIDIQLDGDSLVLKVSARQIQESEGFRIRTLNLLGFFGAAGIDEQGYMFVPDGIGSLIYLNNGKINQEVYAQRIYGEDQNDNSGRRGQITESARLPVFGLKSDNEAWFAVIEQGDGIAAVNADISGRNNSYNNVFASFAIRGEDWLELYKGNRVEEIQLLTDARYNGDLQVRYRFLSSEEANYSGMAKSYRDSLEQQGVLKPITEQGDIPFYMSVLGAVDKRRTILGVPYSGIIPMTTFDQADDIVEQMKSANINNVRMRYLGWFNDGLNHLVPDKVSIDSVLGNKKDLQLLATNLEHMGGRLYPDVSFQHVYWDKANFTPAADAARFVTREQASRTPYNRAFNTMDYDLGVYYLLSPAKLPYYVDNFMKSYERMGITAVSLRDLGDLLHADYRINRMIFRETAKNIVTEQLGLLKQSYPNTLISGGNQYALAYTDQLVNVPLSTSQFSITDQEVPFYQMVIHGYVDYGGSPINLEDDQDIQLQLLRSIELGAAPHFLWSNESSAKLKFTKYDSMFSTQYMSWYEEAVDMYKQVNDVFAELRSAKMMNHIQHDIGVKEVLYDNGTRIYINYTDEPVSLNGTQIDARNFIVGGDNQ